MKNYIININPNYEQIMTRITTLRKEIMKKRRKICIYHLF